MKRYFSLYNGFLFYLAIACAVPECVDAQVVITEIMYDVPGTDTGREWIEVSNAGGEPVDLSSWRLFEANSNHKLVPVGSALIAPGSFAIIADSPEKFKADNTSFEGQIFDSAFSLSGDGESVSLRNGDGADVDVVLYDPSIGAKGDGMSLQRTSDGRWVSASPTPGSATVAQQSQVVSDGDQGSSSGARDSQSQDVSQDSQSELAHSGQEIANLVADEGDLEVSSGRTRLGTVDSALRFSARVRKLPPSVSTSSVDHFWSMGEGSVVYGDVVYHTYRFPGVYSVILNSSVKGSRAVSRVSVRIVKPDLVITSVGDWYVEIENRSLSEINIGGWSIVTDGGRFTIGDDTVIRPVSRLTIPVTSPRLYLSGGSVRLVSPLGGIYAEWRPGLESDVMIGVPAGTSVESLRESIVNALKNHD